MKLVCYTYVTDFTFKEFLYMNITEFAEYAGVSKAAVSRYFNKGYLAADKKAIIEKAIAETGYSPSLQAQTIRTKRTKLIGVILPKLSSESCARVAEGISEVLGSQGYELLLVNTDNNPDNEVKYLDIFRQNRVDGVIFLASIFTPSHKSVLKNMRIPVVIVGQEYQGFNCVSHDDFGAAYALTKLMLERGGKRPAYLGVTAKDEAAGLARHDGYIAALKEKKIPPKPQYMKTCQFNMESGFQQAKAMLESVSPRPDCIFCATDNIAIGASQYCLQNGIRIPEDIMLASVGDTKLGSVAAVPLTTAHLHYRTSGFDAANMLLSKLQKKDSVSHSVKLGYEIITRRSTMSDE